MRKVVVYAFLTIDGVAEDVARFFVGENDPQVDAAAAAVIARQDAVILGRRTYDEWAPFWPTSDIAPFADFINRVPKYVATSTALEAAWANSSAIAGNLADFVCKLRSQPGEDIGVHASISVAQALLAEGLVDELVLIVAPAIAGAGRRLLDNVSSQRLEVIESIATATGFLILRYRLTGLANVPRA